MAANVSGAVLAGGASSRFGSDKAFAKIGDETLLSIALRNLSSVCDDLVVIAPCNAEIHRYAVGGARVACDPVTGQGPLMGIVAALEAAEGERVIIVAVDMPCVQPEVLQLLLDADPDADVVVPVLDGRPEPLHAVYRRSARQALAMALAGGTRKITDAFRGLRVTEVRDERLRGVDPDLRSFWNANRPKELAQIQAALGI